MNINQISDENPKNLAEQLLLDQAKAGQAIEIIGPPLKPLRDGPRLVAIYGGKIEDWVKMSSVNSIISEGKTVQIHWYKNRQTGENVEFKFKREYLKTAPKNQ